MLEHIRTRRAQNGDAGFTLIELLIVIVILGILAAIVVFSVGGITDRGNSSACKATKAATQTAAEAFYAKNGSYPATVAAMSTAPDKFMNTDNVNVAGNVITPNTGGGTWTLTYTPTPALAPHTGFTTTPACP